jgi:hypothetical protein
VVDQLANQYRNKNAVFVEYDVDDSANYRKNMFFAASSGNILPLVVIDSGRETSYGSKNFQTEYKRLVDDALEIPPALAIYAYQEESGSKRLRVYGSITNTSEETYGYDNDASVHIIVYEDRKVIHTQRFVRVAKQYYIDQDLEPGGTVEFDEEIAVTGASNLDKVHAIVLVDYRPGGTGPFLSLQAQPASDEPPPPEEPNHLLEGALDIAPLPYTIEESSRGSRNEPDETPASCANGEGSGVWFTYTPETDEQVVIDTLGSAYDTVLSLWTGTGHPLVEQACNDDWIDPSFSGLQSLLTVDLTAGTQYFIKVGGVNSAQGDIVFSDKLSGDVEPTETPVTPTDEPVTPTDTPETPTDEPVTPTDTPEPGTDIFMPMAKKMVE